MDFYKIREIRVRSIFCIGMTKGSFLLESIETIVLQPTRKILQLDLSIENIRRTVKIMLLSDLKISNFDIRLVFLEPCPRTIGSWAPTDVSDAL